MPGNRGHPRQASATAPAASTLPNPARTSRSAPPERSRHTDVRPRRQYPDAGDGDDELKLSDPVEIPADQYLPKNLSDLLRDATGPPASQPGTEPRHRHRHRRDDRPGGRTTSSPSSVPSCDTLMYATEDEIGQQKTCPDCFSIVEITRPRPKPRRVNEVVDADYEGQLFTLSEPVSLDIYRRTEAGLEPKTMGEEALRKAEREHRPAQARRVRTAGDSTCGMASSDSSRMRPSSCVGWSPPCCSGALPN